MLWCFSIFSALYPIAPWDLFSNCQNPGVLKLIVKSHRWRQTALAVATLFALYEPNALALSLGRITVQSALGEPLRAEVDIPDINAEEAASLKTSIASPAAFKAAGLDYSAAISSLQATLQKRPDGRSYIRLNGSNPINDPFVDVILEASWASGRIVRDYTLLFDPPNLRPSQPATFNPAQVTTPTIRTAPPAPARAPVPPVPRAAEPVKPPAERTSASPGPGNGKVNVKVGDTASKIAAAVKPANVSLDQMLVALLRSNPMAFIGNNVNRIKAGSVMTVPTADQAATTPVSEATQIIVAQSKDFNDFRQKLADNAPTTPVAPAERKVSGNVQTKLEDQRTTSTAPDKLTLSKGAIQKQQAEDQLAKERSASDAATRAAELSKNIQDLNTLGTATTAAASAPLAATSVPSQPGVAAIAAKRPVSVPSPQAQPGVLEGLMEDPLVPGAAIGTIALLALLGLYRSRQRKQDREQDELPPHTHLHAESLFADSGVQHINTQESAPVPDSAEPAISSGGSAIEFSPSQLGNTNEVDPVAEADVYLAYGRDLQAEEILKEALRNNPERLAIHQKLLELFAKRRDLKSFESIAELALAASNGQGPEWERMRELGWGIDPNNVLYRPSVQTSPAPTPVTAPASPVAGTVDLDLDLDFSNSELPTDRERETHDSLADTAPGTIDLDLNQSSAPNPAVQSDVPPVEGNDNTIEFSLPDPVNTPDPSAQPTQPALSTSKFGMLDFDLGSLSLDLDDSLPPDAAHGKAEALATKLALAEEFQAIGDTDGARVLLEEVIAQASGDMKAKAQQALSKLS